MQNRHPPGPIIGLILIMGAEVNHPCRNLLPPKLSDTFAQHRGPEGYAPRRGRRIWIGPRLGVWCTLL